jgi:hypothetical protein
MEARDIFPLEIWALIMAKLGPNRAIMWVSRILNDLGTYIYGNYMAKVISISMAKNKLIRPISTEVIREWVHGRHPEVEPIYTNIIRHKYKKCGLLAAWIDADMPIVNPYCFKILSMINGRHNVFQYGNVAKFIKLIFKRTLYGQRFLWYCVDLAGKDLVKIPAILPYISTEDIRLIPFACNLINGLTNNGLTADQVDQLCNMLPSGVELLDFVTNVAIYTDYNGRFGNITITYEMIDRTRLAYGKKRIIELCTNRPIDRPTATYLASNGMIKWYQLAPWIIE